MSTTQAFRTALHIPYADPDVGEVVTAISAGDFYLTDWASGAAGGAFPNPTEPGQYLISGAAPTFLWEVVTGVDCGVY